MFSYYAPVILLQAFCVYHAYRNNAEQYWYWLILLFPLVGSIIYLVHSYNNRSTLQTLAENVRGVVNSNYKIEQLEKELRFSENFRNKVNLADAYVEVSRYQDAIDLYISCLQGFMADDPSLRMKLLYAYFMNGDYATAADCGNKLELEKSFKDAEERVVYAWSLYLTGQTELAERIFENMDKSFTNYYQRMEYCKFLLKVEKKEEAKKKLTELVEEFEHMKGPERQLKKETFREIKELYTSHVRA